MTTVNMTFATDRVHLPGYAGCARITMRSIGYPRDAAHVIETNSSRVLLRAQYADTNRRPYRHPSR